MMKEELPDAEIIPDAEIVSDNKPDGKDVAKEIGELLTNLGWLILLCAFLLIFFKACV